MEDNDLKYSTKAIGDGRQNILEVEDETLFDAEDDFEFENEETEQDQRKQMPKIKQRKFTEEGKI